MRHDTAAHRRQDGVGVSLSETKPEAVASPFQTIGASDRGSYGKGQRMGRFSQSILGTAFACAMLASCEDSTGAGNPIISLSSMSVAVVGVEGGATPTTASISITNGGTGSLTGLQATVAYGSGQPTGWLTATLADTVAPTELTLTGTVGALAGGQYLASVAVASAGVGNSPQTADVVFVVSDPTQTWESVRVRPSGTCALMPVGAAFCWGAGDLGQIGDGLATSRLVPTSVSGGLTFTAMTVGGQHTCGLTAAGRIYCWGANHDGQLGDGSTTSRRAPVEVAASATFALVTAGEAHTCGLTTSGETHCWGANDAGQLGDSTTARRLTPTLVRGGGPFTTLVAGAAHTCGLSAAGEAYCWGDNASGQLGDSTRMSRVTPTAVARGLVFAELAAGSVHTCGRTAGGEVYCWGGNASGQLGDGTVSSRQVPTAVGSNVVFAGLARDVGGAHSCGLDGAGAVFCWGDNTRGQLGDGTRTNRLLPTEVASGVPFTKLSGGGLHTCGIAAAGGTAYCWGANSEGQLGDNSRTDRLSPVEVMRP